MTFKEIKENKKQYIDLLLLADEQENMIDRYLERGMMFVLDDNGIKAECVVTDEGNGVLEIKNLAVDEAFHGKGYGRAMIDFIQSRFKGDYNILRVGTGESPLTVPFYEKCGFVYKYRVKDFFTDNYNPPIIECGVMLRDMVYFEKFFS